MRYFVGIDLGTTNSVVNYVDSLSEDNEFTVFPIPQVVESGVIAERESLPSYIYLPDDNEFIPHSFDLPWVNDEQFCIGLFAQKNAALVPNKVIASSKSWLCMESVDRQAKILPWQRGNVAKQLSPVHSAFLILDHIKNAWNNAMASDDESCRLENQQVVLTIPASFDAIARDLTIKAAEQAGLHVTLLEEPLAAFYAWLEDNSGRWREDVSPGDVILVCDIGGGTSDFSLVNVLDRDGVLEFERLAVGHHILLGGDNMDLTLAHIAAMKYQKEQGKKLSAQQIMGLTHACRQAKENLLSEDCTEPQRLTVLGSGSSVIGGSITIELTPDDVKMPILEGFLPLCDLGETVKTDDRSGIRALGLNYAADPAITRHLSSFLTEHCTSKGIFPNCILFNGGVAKSDVLQQRIIHAIQRWIPEGSDVNLLVNSSLDLAVAHGASYYASTRTNGGVRVKAGSSHSYYIGIESSMPAIPGFAPPVEALCVVPLGMEEGTKVDIPYDGIGLLVGDITEFRFYYSTSREDDEVGAIVAGDDERLVALTPLVAELPVEDEALAGQLIPIRLQGELTEIGTLQLWCISEKDASMRWKLEFDIREI
jgi:hypothetical protein